MAATAVYVKIAKISGDGALPVSPETKAFDNIGATTAAFGLSGGVYGVTCVGATFGTVTLQILGEDGSTYLTALPAFAANGYATVSLPAGTYKIAVA
jgi:hypothetical protein